MSLIYGYHKVTSRETGYKIEVTRGSRISGVEMLVKEFIITVRQVEV